MTSLLRYTRPLTLSFVLSSVLLLLAGCGTTQNKAKGDPNSKPEFTSDSLRVGDLVTVNFSGVTDPPTIKHEERIKDDGHITLPYIGAIQAAGKTRAELQEDILKSYVPKYYTHLTVNVGSEARYFYVEGQVRNPNKFLYAGEMSVLKCVAAAGGFTDFAKKTRVEVTRANGKKEKINCEDALTHPAQDIPIYPDDLIYVPRRYF